MNNSFCLESNNNNWCNYRFIGCDKSNCKFKHPIEDCAFGDNCKFTFSCSFDHSHDHVLKWINKLKNENNNLFFQNKDFLKEINIQSSNKKQLLKDIDDLVFQNKKLKERNKDINELDHLNKKLKERNKEIDQLIYQNKKLKERNKDIFDLKSTLLKSKYNLINNNKILQHKFNNLNQQYHELSLKVNNIPENNNKLNAINSLINNQIDILKNNINSILLENIQSNTIFDNNHMSENDLCAQNFMKNINTNSNIISPKFDNNNLNLNSNQNQYLSDGEIQENNINNIDNLKKKKRKRNL